MLSNTARTLLLLSSASAMAIALSGRADAAAIKIPGGGASLPAQDYAGPNVVTNANPTAPSEEKTFNTANPSTFLQYFYASSGKGQAAFALDDPKQWQYQGTTPIPTTVKYAASDAFLTPSSTTSVVNGYTYTTVAGIPGITATYALRASQDGALIQVPMLGLGIAIPAASGNAAVKANGTLHLTESDLCGIFSGKITNYGNINNPLKGLTGPITVYYRSDSSGTSFQFTNHLKAVCNSSNSNFPAAGLATAPTTTFASLFTGGSIPGNFNGQSGSGALATAMAGTVTTKGGHTVKTKGDPTGIGYISPDFTDISANGAGNAIAVPNPPGGFINTAALFDAALQSKNATGATAFLTPTVKNISAGLSHPGAGSTHPKPPTGAAASNPLNWVPSIPVVNQGYPIVGYTDWELAQCYASGSIANALTAFLTAHFSGNYNNVINANGFTLPSKPYSTAILQTFLNSSSARAIAAKGAAGTCKSVTGR